MSELKKSVSRILSFFAMVSAGTGSWGVVGSHEAQGEVTGEWTKDDAVVLSFMGSGASDSLTVGDFRRLRRAYQEEYAANSTDKENFEKTLEYLGDEEVAALAGFYWVRLNGEEVRVAEWCHNGIGYGWSFTRAETASVGAVEVIKRLEPPVGE